MPQSKKRRSIVESLRDQCKSTKARSPSPAGLGITMPSMDRDHIKNVVGIPEEALNCLQNRTSSPEPSTEMLVVATSPHGQHMTVRSPVVGRGKLVALRPSPQPSLRTSAVEQNVDLALAVPVADEQGDNALPLSKEEASSATQLTAPRSMSSNDRNVGRDVKPGVSVMLEKTPVTQGARPGSGLFDDPASDYSPSIYSVATDEERAEKPAQIMSQATGPQGGVAADDIAPAPDVSVTDDGPATPAIDRSHLSCVAEGEAVAEEYGQYVLYPSGSVSPSANQSERYVAYSPQRHGDAMHKASRSKRPRRPRQDP